MTFGAQTVMFVSLADTGSPGGLGTYPQVETLTPVKGCHHRPLTFSEAAEFDTNVATELWKTTAPPEPAVLAAKSDDEIRVGGMSYRIVGGVRPHADLSGELVKVTVVSQRHRG